MAFKDIIKLAFGNNLILGHCPDKLPLEEVSKKDVAEKREIESFGLFDSNQANYNTYYPDVTVEDLQPKDNEFIEPVFRALSEVIVHKNWNPVDFGENQALKKSMSLLKGSTVNADHEMAIGNAMGAVAGVSWEESYKTPSGIVVPAGINAKLKLDGKSHPRVARAIMMDPPAIHSTSVTVEFLFDKSHSNLSDQEFFSKLGTFDKDGKLIRRIVNKVVRYYEISLVHHGADPYAQKITKDGQLNNPMFADVSYNSANPNKKPATKYFFMDFKSDLVYNAEEVTIPEETNDNNNAQNNIMNKQFLLALAMVLSLKNTVGDKQVDYTEETITDDVVRNAITQLQKERVELAKRPADITAEEVTRLREVETQYNKIKDMTGLAEFRDARTTSLRKETVANFTKLKDGTPDAAMLKVLNEASYDTLEVLNQQYATQLDEKFPLSCKDCNSTNVSRASASSKEESGGGNPAPKSQTAMEIRNTISKKKSKAAFNHMHAGLPAEEPAK